MNNIYVFHLYIKINQSLLHRKVMVQTAKRDMYVVHHFSKVQHLNTVFDKQKA